MSKKIDFKWYLMAAIALGSLYLAWLPIYNDLRGKSLTIETISTSDLNPATKDTISGLTVLIDGTALSSPYHSILRIRNDGTKPLTTTDFAAPLEILVGDKIELFRASIVEKSPPNIPAAFTYDKQGVQVSGTLLNPQDSITIALVTANGKPTFSSRFRIVGIQDIPFTTVSNSKMPIVQAALLLIEALLVAIPGIAIFIRTRQNEVRPRSLIFLGVLGAEVGTLSLTSAALSILHVNGALFRVLALVGVLFFATPLAMLLLRKFPRSIPSLVNEQLTSQGPMPH